MLIERQINGDTCLSYVIGETESLQSFHLGMLTTNPQLPALPIHCQYVDGVETLILPLHEMVTVKGLIESQRGPALAQLLMMLGKSIQSLMAFQLNPENIVFDERYIYIDASYKTLYLPYLPLKAEFNEPKAALSELLVKWMDAGMNTQGTFTHPLFMQLLLKLRQENCSFRTLLEVLTKAELQSNEANHQPFTTQAVTTDVPNPVLSLKSNQKATVKAPSSGRAHSNINFIIDRNKVLAISPIGAAIISSGLVGVLAPMSPSSKLGVAMVMIACAVYLSQKLTAYLKQNALAPTKPMNANQKDINVSHSKKAVSELSAIQTPAQAPVQKPIPTAAPSPASFISHCQSGSEETVLLSTSQAKAVLMVRDSDGPRYFKMQKEVVTIGRNPSICDLILDETGIGRMHAEIHHNQGQYYIKDNQSLNGTYVNGKRITSNQYFQLNTGDLIKIAHKEVVFS